MSFDFAPTDIKLGATSVDENMPDTTVGSLYTHDPNGLDTHTYALVSGEGDTGNSLFSITGWKLRTRDALNFEASSSHSIRIRTTDNSGKSFEKVFTITVENIYEAPPPVACNMLLLLTP